MCSASMDHVSSAPGPLHPAEGAASRPSVTEQRQGLALCWLSCGHAGELCYSENPLAETEPVVLLGIVNNCSQTGGVICITC